MYDGCGMKLVGLGRASSGLPDGVFGRGESGATGLRQPISLCITAPVISPVVFDELG